MSDHSTIGRTRSVSFGDVTVLRFPVVLGTNPAVSAGCPIELGWEQVAEEIQEMELYEFIRGAQRKSDRKGLLIPVPERAKRLMQAGYSIDEIANAVIAVQELQRQRAESLKGTTGEAFLDLMGKTGKLPMTVVRGVLRLGGLVGKPGESSPKKASAPTE